ncbi:MAG: LysR family transcriptional regulator [Alteromonadaceae bacterium]|nr:LysR family transcriptional regulator [Alteromonadaceae bacterium]
MNLNIRHLLCAIKIMDCGALSQAAEQIHLTQSALTQGINKLEGQLQCRMFERSHAGMKATDTGQAFLLRVKRAFAHLEEFSSILFAHDKLQRSAFIRAISSRQLRALIYIVQLQSYTAAAQFLGLSQPTLHRTIKDLEQLCQQRLLHRSPSGVEASWRAKQLRRYASLFFAELQQGIDEIHEVNGRMSGSLRVGSLPLARSEIVPLAVLTLNDEFPDASISIIDGPYSEQYNSLLHGQLDMIVGALRPAHTQQDMQQIHLFDDQLSVVFRADHPLANRQSISAAELQQLDWVAPAKSTPARHVFSQIFTRRGLTPPSHVIECSSLVAVRGILLNSQRAALLPARQVEVEVRAGLLTVCPMTLTDTDRVIGLTLRKNWRPTKMQQRFLEIIQQSTTVAR